MKTIAIISLWSGLGFIRGMNSYDYKQKNGYKTTFMYSNKIVHGIGGTLVYLNPFLSLFLLYKEMYRLEVNIRCLENEKNSEFYNELY